MKVAILAGGLGTRLAEETETKPKPMVEIGGSPILWHIMKHYWTHGFGDFAIALGYKGDYIKRYMVDYASLPGDLTVSMADGRVARRGSSIEEWTVDLVETGLLSTTGERIKRIRPYLNNETFMLTYGDGVSNVNLTELLDFHRSHGKLATVTAVRPPARFGTLAIEGNQVVRFDEKPPHMEGWINGGFFVMEQGIFDYIHGDASRLEVEILESLADDGQLMAFQHESFWQPMDTYRDKLSLEALWQADKAEWKTWE